MGAAVAKSFGYDACVQTPTNGCPCTSGFGACAGKPVSPTSAQCIANPDNCLLVRVYLKDSPYQLTFEEDGKATVDRFAA